MGMIIIGYPGIGKSSIKSKDRDSIIDLESSVFKVNDSRDDNWYIVYCNQAVSLAKQGYIVLVSSHNCVCNELCKHVNEVTIVSITPARTLRNEWLDKLYQRYISDKTTQNYIAWKKAEKHYDDNITEIASNPLFSNIIIVSMDYSLIGIIRQLKMIFVNPLKYRKQPFICRYGDQNENSIDNELG